MIAEEMGGYCRAEGAISAEKRIDAILGQ